MATQRIQLEFCAPEHPPLLLEANEVVLPGAAGVFTVLPGHTPLLTTLGVGVLTAYEDESNSRLFAIHGGFAEILGDHITILADVMELADNIDRSRAEAAAERANAHLDKPSEGTDLARAEIALARSNARIQALAGHDL